MAPSLPSEMFLGPCDRPLERVLMWGCGCPLKQGLSSWVNLHVRWLPSFVLSGVALGDVTFSCLVDWPRGAALFAQTSLPLPRAPWHLEAFFMFFAQKLFS